MTALVLDAQTGISGDMTVAALLDLGASREKLLSVLKSLPDQQFEITISRVKKNALDACDFKVTFKNGAPDNDHDMNYLFGQKHEHHHEEDHGHEIAHDHHHHHADEVFTSWGRETIKKFTREGLEKILEALSESDKYGIILRAKGMLPAEDGTWIYFDMVPEETEIREGAPEYTGRLCVIGSKLDEHALEELFGIA